ncbi:MAG: hypothetical protein RBS24_05725 [Bacilli bacterium]|nr:hypothetical protein [Bacilli bacterium]
MAEYIFSQDPMLEAVNEIISSVGSPPINSLSNITNVDGIDALRMLNKTSRRIQSTGWEWNRQDSVTFLPDTTTGKIAYPNDIIKAVATNRLIRKDGYFFDLDANTDRFTSSITITELVREIAFNDLPEAARDYITAVTTRDFQRIKVGSVEADQAIAQREAEALIRLNALEIDMGQFNLYENNETISSNQAR